MGFILYLYRFLQLMAPHSSNYPFKQQIQNLTCFTAFSKQMIQDGHIYRSEGVEILETFLSLQCDYQRLAQAYRKRNRTQQQLTNFVKSKVRELILQIQYHLCRMNLISQLKLFDNSTIHLFDELTKMNRFMPEEYYEDFILEEKCKFMQVEKISSKVRMEIYTLFLNFAQQNNLFHNSIGQDQTTFGGPHENPDRIYSHCEQELICFLYEVCQGNYSQIESRLRERGYTQSKFEGNRLFQNLKNLELIGLYRCYRMSVRSLKGKGMMWEQFIKEDQCHKVQIEKWEPNMMILLIRIAIRDDATAQQIKSVCWYMNRRFNDKPLVQVPKKAKDKKTANRTVDMPEINRMRGELLAVLRTKIQFNQVNLTI